MEINSLKRIGIGSFKRYLCLPLALGVAGFVAGFSIVICMMTVAHENTYISLGTLLFAMFGWVGLLLSAVASFTDGYKNMVKFSISRRNALVGTAAVQLLVGLVLGMVLLTAKFFERCVYRIMFSGFAADAEILTDYLGNISGIALTVLAAIALALFCAGVIVRFGAKGLAVLYFGFFIVMVGLPRIDDGGIVVNIGGVLSKLDALPPMVKTAGIALLVLGTLGWSVNVLLNKETM
ncbi:MAG: hypothetical protein RR011_02990 [Oscillospiraceae bacterium]